MTKDPLDLPPLGQRLRAALVMKGVDQRKLAKRLGVSESNLSHWLSGRHEPPYDKLVAMCEFLGVSTDWVLGMPGAESPSVVDTTLRSTSKKSGGARPTFVGKALRSTLDYEFDEFEKRLLTVLRAAVRAELEAAGVVPTKG